MLRKTFDREWTRNNRALHALLALVDIEVTLADVTAWSDDQARDAEWWAGHEHLNASDNNVRRYPKPDFLPASETDKRLELWGAKPTNQPSLACSWTSRAGEPCRRPAGHRGKHKPPAAAERPESPATEMESGQQERATDQLL